MYEQALTGKVEVSPRPWEQTALDDRLQFAHGLQVSRLPKPQVKGVLIVRDDVATIQAQLEDQIKNFYASSRWRYSDTPPEVQELQNTHYSVARRLSDWFNERTFTVVDATEIQLEVPLFSFGAADVTGCRTTYTTTQNTSRSGEWSLTLFGTGFGGSSKIKASVTSSFSAIDGQMKLVFLNVTLPVELISVSIRGVTMGTEYRIDASQIKASTTPGLRQLPKGSQPQVGAVIDHYPLAGDPSGAPATYEYVYERTSALDVELGAEAFNSKLALTVRSESITSLTLTHELIGGHDYELRKVVGQDGIAWSPPR